jgi:hypothetical protein
MGIDAARRRVLGIAAMTIAAAQFGIFRSADAQSSSGTLKQIAAGVLNIGYAEAGPRDGRVVILLHGWPYDIHSYVDVAPLFASAGNRVIVPYLRGYGTTRFLSAQTFRDAQQWAVALHVIALVDALRIDKAILGGTPSRPNAADLATRRIGTSSTS